MRWLLALRWRVWEAVGVGDGLVGEVAVLGVEAAEEGGVFGAGFFEAVVGELFDVAVGDVGEGLGGGTGVGGGHVRDAVMDDTFFDVGGMGVGGGPKRGLKGVIKVKGVIKGKREKGVSPEWRLDSA
jgi:hypothetical protein